MIDLLTGELIRVTDKGTWDETPDEFASTSVFSPDGRQLAYAYWENGDIEIRTIGVDGTNERTVLDASPSLRYVVLHAWRDDEILVKLWPREDDDRIVEIAFIGLEEGRIRRVKRFESDAPAPSTLSPLELSPDGRYLAYSRPSPAATDFDIVVVSADDGNEISRLEGVPDDRVLMWTSDGRGLVFWSDRELTHGVWSQGIEDGLPIGQPTLVRGGIWGLEPIGRSRDEYYFGVITEARRVHMARFDPESGALLSEPAPVAPTAARGGRPVWSPDGGHLAYAVEPARGPIQSTSTLVIRSLAGDPIRNIEVPVRQLNPIKWTSGGTVVAAARNPASDDLALYRIELGSGSLEVVASSTQIPAPSDRLAVSADGAAAYFPRSVSGTAWTLAAVDLGSGQERELHAAVEASPPSIYPSPGGRHLAVRYARPETLESVLAVVPAEGGSVRELYRTRSPRGITDFVVWAPDEDYLFFATLDVETHIYTRWKVEASGGEPTLVQELVHPGGWGDVPTSAVLHPDGNRIGFVDGSLRGEIWMLRNRIIEGARPERAGS